MGIYRKHNIPSRIHSRDSRTTTLTPQKISYLHIDLNSARPTRFALEFFFPRLLKRGIIVFDDYGSKNYKDTKIVVNKFFKDKPGILMPLPTGQAIYYR